eukprot:TRINITY_DN4454_c0_g1_i2.p1 TRINITY_DN4454_c0_g1~~TRINITY_DN4454_c0_g1_i2.p1  ORF type:complete len:271 (+),score=42.60 TRINITY_DN4454_c0_g1_i2:56-868(+)
MKSVAFALACLLFACRCHAIKVPGGDVIPHILHKLAPGDESHWPKAWNICLKSWKRAYPDWEVKMWNDEDIENLVKIHYPQHFAWFKALPHQIERVDAARSFVLHKHGGLYADMDVYAYKKLQLPQTGQVVILGSHNGRDEIVQNSLMASPPNHAFWDATFLQMKTFLEKYPQPWTKAIWTTGFADYVVEGTGPNMLKHTMQERHLEQMVSILPPEEYMGGDSCTPKTCFSRHIGTGCWAPGVACSDSRSDLNDEVELNKAKLLLLQGFK